MEYSKKNQTITMSLEDFIEYEVWSRKLIALENGGVDNWAGYDNALEHLDSKELNEGSVIELINELNEAAK